MLINPTIDFLVQRAAAVQAMITDTDTELSVRQVVALMNEFDQLISAMKAVSDKRLFCDTDNVSMQNVLWAWYCSEHRIPQGTTANSIVNV